MTELQMGLIGLGAAAVVGVLGYNKWQEMRHRKVAEAMLKPQHDDVLLGGGTAAAGTTQERSEPELMAPSPVAAAGRVEPSLDAPVLDATDPTLAVLPDVPEVMPEASAQAMPPTVDALADERLAEPVDDRVDERVGEVPAALLDPRIEFVVAMELVEPVSVVQILHSQREAIQRISKPVHWVGYNERNREWERLSVDNTHSVRRLRVGLQLVNRLGPASEADVATFTTAMQALADELMAVADMPSSRVLDQAAEIDRFCAAVDLEIGLNLVSRGSAFSGTKIRALAEAAGMLLGADGIFTRYDDDGRAQFHLQNYETARFSPDNVRNISTHGVTFLLDVPRVDHGERVFMQMIEIAKRFAETLQGALVDDNRQPLSDSQLDHIRREFIGKPQATMASFDLAAGSPQALRLFS